MKKTLLAAVAAVSLGLAGAQAQSIDYGMVAATVQSPFSSILPDSTGGFLLFGVTPGSGFNPTNASLASILNNANMLSVSNSFVSIQSGGQFYNPGLPTMFGATASNIPTATQLYVLASTSSSFDNAAPWALVTGSDVGWFSPNPADPLGSSIIELSLFDNRIISAGDGGPGLGAYWGNTPGSTTVTDPNGSNLVLVPEPSTYAMLAMSAAAFGGYVLRRRRR